MKTYWHANPADVNMNYFINVTAEKGKIAIHSGDGVGASLDDADATVVLPTGQQPSGTSPAGMLVCDVVNKDLTQTRLNEHKNEIQIGGKAHLMRRGTFLVDTLKSGDTPGAGDKAYMDNAGDFTTDGSTDKPQVGRFLGAVDTDGYVLVEVNIV